MLTPPSVLWRTEPGSLYTLLLLNADIEESFQEGRRSPPRKFVHWMLSNIAQNNLDAADVVLPYIPSISVRHDGVRVKKDPFFSQRHLFLVYRQKINLRVQTK